MRDLTMASLFAGIGGFEEAGRRNGIKTKWNCEIDEDKRRILNRHFPDAIQYADIRNVHYPEHVDILTGGFPCQDISGALKNKESKGISGERSGLWKEYARLLGEVRPSVIVFENSPRIVVSGLEQVLCDLTRGGYMCEWRPVYATQFGYPHYRKRTYGIAYATGIGWESVIKQGGLIYKAIQSGDSRVKTTDLLLSLKRYERDSDFSAVRMDDGLRKELDLRRIHGCGNAVVVDIPEAILKQIKLHWPT